MASKALSYLKTVLGMMLAFKVEFLLEKLLLRPVYYVYIPYIIHTAGNWDGCLIIGCWFYGFSTLFLFFYDLFDIGRIGLFRIDHYVNGAKSDVTKGLKTIGITVRSDRTMDMLVYCILVWQCFPAIPILFSRGDRKYISMKDRYQMLIATIASTLYFAFIGNLALKLPSWAIQVSIVVLVVLTILPFLGYIKKLMKGK